ncbi:MAG: hypothetical protein F6K26_45965 [Moorea sp. SIO2I5]|nr:hypothetical protein [Moorena sp. SIO2I5]
MGRWGDGEMGRWGDGEIGRWGSVGRLNGGISEYSTNQQCPLARID